MVVIKVAIMGAGLSGLSCALTLEKHGIEPTIFEDRSQVGDRFICAELLLPVLTRPISDPIAYFSDKHGIYLKPISAASEFIFLSPNYRATLRGNLGFTNIRGRHENSLENQLAKQLKSKIIFNSQYSYEDLLQEYTHIVLATGDGAYSSKLQNYDIDSTVTLKGGTIEGSFEVYRSIIWLNNDFAPQGYAYLIPYSDKEANIVIGFPNYEKNDARNLDYMWEKFIETVSKELNQEIKITDNFEVEEYIMGKCIYPRIGNTFFAGNCFGALMPAFGFGQIPAMLTGIYAADSIYGLGDYNEMTASITNSFQNSMVVRRAMELMDNDNLDSIVKFLSKPTINKIINNPKRDPFKTASYMLRPLVKLKGKSPAYEKSSK